MEIGNLKDLNKLAIEEENQEILNDCSNKILNILKEIKNFEIKCFLSGENDKLDIYIEIHAGAGGTESQDWAEMLRRMYLKWFDKKRFGYELISEHKGEEAGIKSCTLKVTGENLYGLMKKESGVHRLVRISPFDSGARRHTSFASVWIYPSVDDEIDIVIDEKDLRIDTYRSSGAGGQHACLVADALGLEEILVHPMAGVLSAYGIGLAHLRVLRQVTLETGLNNQQIARIRKRLDRLSAAAKSELVEQGVLGAKIIIKKRLYLKYVGTDIAEPVNFSKMDVMRTDFEAAHRKRYGFTIPKKELIV